MVRLLGIDLPRNKRIEYALTYIHGIGLTSAKKIVQLAERGCSWIFLPTNPLPPVKNILFLFES